MEIGAPIGSRLPHWIAEAPELTLLFDYNGSLAPGDVLEVDAEDLLVQKNSTNDRPNFEGEYVELPTGDNTIHYYDGESGREVKLEVIKEDKHI